MGARSRKKAKKSLPRFASEENEREFWAAQDSTDYMDWNKAVRAAFPNLKPSTATISLRLPVSMLEGAGAEEAEIGSVMPNERRDLRKMRPRRYLGDPLTRCGTRVACAARTSPA